MTKTDFELAERLSMRRARILPALAVIFVAQQATYLSPRHGAPIVEDAKIAAWLLLSVVLLLALTTGGFWFRPAHVREMMNDETTKAHRAEAFRAGFLASMIGAIALYFLTMFASLSGQDAIHLIMAMGIAAALLRFGILERRALRDA